jgi:methanethiol S-methyltransferase
MSRRLREDVGVEAPSDRRPRGPSEGPVPAVRPPKAESPALASSTVGAAAVLIFAYGLACYALFMGTFLYLIGFVANLVVPKSIDGGSTSPTAIAILTDVLLLGLFGVQHSAMARPGFKRRWNEHLSPAAQRSTYVLASSLCVWLLVWFWRPIPSVIWDVENVTGRGLIWALCFGGWALVLYASFLIDHFDLFGLRQVFLHLRNQQPQPPAFKTPWLYQLVRNPLMLGFLIAFWATPTMTWGHLLFSAGMTAYVLIGIWFEERDLATHLGEPYRQYRGRTPMLLPRRKGPATSKTAPKAGH